MRKLLIALALVCWSNAFSQTKITIDGDYSIEQSETPPVDIIEGNISFTISSTKVTSGGIYKDNVLRRTLWNNVPYAPGTHTFHWDGKDDNGNILTGLIVPKVLTNNVNYTWQGVLCNSSSSFTGSGILHGYDFINSAVVAGENIYCAIGYNEAAGTKIKIPISNPTSKISILPSGQGTTQQTNHVASNGEIVYWHEYDPAAPLADNKKHWIHATSISTDAQVTFAEGAPFDPTHSIHYNSVIDLSTDAIKGLAAGPDVDFLFSVHTSSIKVFDANGELVQTLSFTTPKAAYVEGTNLWVLSGTTTLQKYPINSNGTLGSVSISISGLTAPTSINATDGLLYVTDNSQVKAFNSSSGASAWTLGQSGGYSASSTVANDKFYFSPTKDFITVQSDGSFWVNDYSNYRTQHFNSSRTYINNISYLPVTYIISVDENDPTKVFAGHLQYNVNYSITLGPNNGSWSLAKNWLYNLPVDNNFQESFKDVYTLSNGRTYTYIRDGIADPEIVELVPGDNLRRTGIVYNVDYSLTKDGGLVKQWKPDYALGYQVYVKKPLTGFDGSNNPIWGAEFELDRSPLVEADDPAWQGNGQEYKPNEVTSTGIRMAFYGGKNLATNTSFHLGGIKDGMYMWKTARSTHTSYIGPFPTDGAFDIGNGVSDFAGTNAMAIDRSIFWGYHGEFHKDGQTNIWNHFYDNGLMLGQFGTAEGSYREGYPAMAGNGFSSKVVKVGEDYYLYHNDESYHSGIHRFKIDNVSSIEYASIEYPTTNVVPAIDYIDLMSGLPFNSTLPNSLGWTRTTPNENFSAYTSRLTYDKHEGRDVYMTFSEGTGTKVVTKTLGLALPTSTWSFNTNITWNGTTPNYSSGGGGVFLNLLDNTGKKITTFYYTTNYGIDEDGHIMGNNVELFADDLATIGNGLTKELNNLSISVSSGTITFNYAGHSASTSVVAESGADITRPTTLEIEYIEDAVVHYGKGLGITNSRFSINIPSL